MSRLIASRGILKGVLASLIGGLALTAAVHAQPSPVVAAADPLPPATAPRLDAGPGPRTPDAVGTPPPAPPQPVPPRAIAAHPVDGGPARPGRPDAPPRPPAPPAPDGGVQGPPNPPAAPVGPAR